MSLASVETPDVRTALRKTFEAQRAAFAREPYPTYEARRDRIEKLCAALQDRRAEILEAVSADFGHRSKHETLQAEVFMSISAGRHILRHLKRWMQRERRSVMLVLQPASAEVMPQPLGVVGVISPWNYPVQLAVIPMMYALAAGNRVMLKPSELTPRTSALMDQMYRSLFPEDLVSVAEGNAEVGAAFSELPFDHLFYTGSTHVGRLVMTAAAKNLTPVTLELGGKSPAIVHPDFPVETAAERIAANKMFNAGQTCVSPDYILVTSDRADALCDAIVRQVSRMYPRLADNPDYTSVINARHADRLRGYLADAREKGASIVPINPAAESFEGTGNKMPPTLIRSVNDEMLIMQEEIFGPLLPIVEVATVDEALDYVNAHPRPLALYYFDNDGQRVERVLTRTHSGGVTVNDCMMHVVEEHLPFGGVGPSGMGAYHGKEGFDTFSHRKAVLRQSRINGRWIIQPPYGRRIERLLDWLL